jgi:transposase
MIAQLQDLPLPSMVQLGKTLHAWREEIATMWRFTRNNGITEGFTPKWRSSSAGPTASETSTIQIEG